jgi:predicted DCC family thiol-disulfide oxidoreductase YuxK
MHEVDAPFGLERDAVLFDGDCGFCQAAIERLRHLRRDVRYIPFQSVSPAVLEAVHVESALLAAQMLLLSRDGRRYAGADAFNELLQRVFPWSILIWLARVSPLVLCWERAAYARIAANRHRISAALGLNRCSVEAKHY